MWPARLPRKRSRRFLLALVIGSLVGPGACSSKDCPPVADLGPAADSPQPVEARALERGLASCKQATAKCAAGEINAFGFCLAEATMAKVPAGEFTMGKDEAGKPWAPAHKVTLKAYLIDITEVTSAQYQACVDCGACKKPLRTGSNTGREPYYGNLRYADFPVIYTSWQDAKTYCQAIGKRLPTEAEWEHAARGTSGGDYPWGSEAPGVTQANYGGYFDNDTVAVKEMEGGKSSFGVFHMAGNVWEWVADVYDAGYYGSSPPTDPTGPASGTIRVIRGGGFNSVAAQVKSYIRFPEAELAAYSYLGFRCAKEKW